MPVIGIGTTYPLGSSITPTGVNFSVHSKNCTGMELLLFADVNDASPTATIKLDANQHQTFHYWHVHVEGLKPGQVYAYRAQGPFLPKHGMRFDGEKILLDPYGRAVAIPEHFDREAAARPGDNTPHAMKSVVADVSQYDWEGDTQLCRPFNKTIIYEMHIRGFTQHPSSGVP
jgi:isoamylase